jgi:signal transduction histidine kinase
LGLAIVKTIADAHGATLTLSTGPDGHGLRVIVSFPPYPSAAG